MWGVRSARKERRKMARHIVIGIAIGIVLIAALSTGADPGKEKAAVMAAQKWVSLVDRGKYAESWKEAAGYFKAAVSQE
jgi:L-cystine uptake protein TcyP (sodium:dicarboxylate symporter family)